MKLTVKTYPQLTLEELYRILQVRSAVFVVEQNCPYLDPDGNDFDALHVMLEDESGALAGYLRAYPLPEKPGTVRLGRVLTLKRGEGYGGILLREGLKAIRSHFAPRQIYLASQVYAQGFYEREGFTVCSGEYLDDGIPHVDMILNTDEVS